MLLLLLTFLLYHGIIVIVKPQTHTIKSRKEVFMVKIKHMDKYNWKDIGKRIRKEREYMEVSQSDLMGKIGRSPESYRVLGRWEKAKARPQLEDMLELCKAYETRRCKLCRSRG